MSRALDDTAVLVSPDDNATPGRLEKGGNVREVGEDAVWTVSSSKCENGVNNLRDDNLETFWQSAGMQPHLISIQFHRKRAIEAIYIYLSYKEDESYCPRRISVCTGNSFGDMRQLVDFELQEPTGWVRIPTLDTAGRPVRTFFLQIAMLSNQLGGQDTRLRQIKLYSPLHQNAADVSVLRNVHFTSSEFRMFSSIR